MKPGRNAQCPCGSGKKYKKCCMENQVLDTSLLYEKLRQAHDRLIDKLIALAEKTFGEAGVAMAAWEFFLWPDELPEDEVLNFHAPAFFPWYLFNWYYDPLEFEDDDMSVDFPEDETIAELYAAKSGDRSDSLASRILSAANRQPYSFYEVEFVDQGNGLRVRDLLTREACEVTDRSACQTAQAGDILFARVARIPPVDMLMGCSPLQMSPGYKPSIIRLRQRMMKGNIPITKNDLFEWDSEIRTLYFDLVDAHRQTPELCNTEGDPLVFQTVYFEIDSAESAFRKLKNLSVLETEEELRADAEYDDKGNMTKAVIPWSRLGKKGETLENILLGRIRIDGKQLAVEVNSDRRAGIIRTKIEKRLKSHARFMAIKIEKPKAILENTGDIPPAPVDGMSQAELMQLPEVQEKLRQMLIRHWESWPNQKLPALGGKTPRQAVKTEDGREMVEALLMEAERAGDGIMRSLTADILPKVRKRLGLTV